MDAENVTIVYRRGEKELPARAEEIQHAKEEGIQFRFFTSPLEILGNENSSVRGLLCQKMQPGEPGEMGRCTALPIPCSEFCIDADTVIVAIGTSPNPLISRTTDNLETDIKGRIITSKQSTKTTKNGVYAGGDAVTGAATVILAMGAGKQAACKILDFLVNEKERGPKAPTFLFPKHKI